MQTLFSKSTLLLRSRFAAILAALFLLSALMPAMAFAYAQANDQIDGQVWSSFDVQGSLMPEVELVAGALVTPDGRVLWSRNIDERHAPASLTKIMTAIIALEEMDPEEYFTLPSMPIGDRESRAFLRPGDELNRKQLLQALMIVSGNDAAVAIATLVAGDVPSFVEIMNRRAAELGMENTNFNDASGLDFPNQYTTALDMATLSRFAMSIPEFREIVGTIETEFTTNRTRHELLNTNILLQSYDGATGVKTGRTTGAGFNVVVSAQRNDFELYAIVLGAPADLVRFFDARRLLDFGFTHYREQKLALEGTVIGSSKVSNFPDRYVEVAVTEDIIIPVLDIAGPIEQSIEILDARSPVRRGDELGHISFAQNDRLIARVPIASTQDVESPFFLIQWYYNALIAWRNR